MANKYAGTKTEKNLMDAFAGESMARNKYTLLFCFGCICVLPFCIFATARQKPNRQRAQNTSTLCPPNDIIFFFLSNILSLRQ